MCLNWLHRRSSRARNPTNVQQNFIQPHAHQLAKRKVKSAKTQEPHNAANMIQQTQADSILTREFDEQTDLVNFKYKLERNSTERFELFRNCMSQCKSKNTVLSDHQIKETHEKYKKDSCLAFRSVFYDYFNSNDLEKAEMLRETYINLEAKINSTLNEYLETTSINIGIYVDKQSVIVATSKNYREPEIIQKIPSEIAFLPKMITIGKNAGNQQGNHFNLHDLIKSSPSATQSVYFQVPEDSNPSKIEKFPLNSEEIIAIYFEKLLADVKSLKRVDEIGSMVVTIPFTLTTFEKSRLQHAMRMAGYPNIRIISSLLATAVVYVGDIGYHLRTKKSNNVVLIAQYSENSFSMALVEVTPNGITTKTCTGLENMAEGEDKSFQHAHQLLYNNESITTEQEIYVTSTYKKAVRYLSSEAQLKKLDGVILIEEMRYGTGISDIFQKLFKNKLRVRLVAEGPVAGACVLASRVHVSSLILPPPVSVLDASRANIGLSCGSREWQFHFRNKAFQPGVAFTLPVVVASPGCTINLTEIYLKGKIFSLAGKYRINLKHQNVAEDRAVLLRFWMTQDGVITASGELINSTSGGYVLVENTLGSETNISARSQLLLHYKSLAIEEESTKDYPPSYHESQSETNSTAQTDFEFFVRTPSPTLDIIEEEEDDSYTEETIVSTSSMSTNESPYEFPSNLVTPDPVVIDSTSVQAIQVTISKALEEAIQIHNRKMYQVTDIKEPFTEKQIQDFHTENLYEITKGFNQGFSPLLHVSMKFDDALEEAENMLIKTANSQLPTYFKRHENKIEEISKTLRKFTLEGECLYDNSMEGFEYKGKTMQEVALEHARIVKEVKATFREKVGQQDLLWQEEFCKELEAALEEKLQDIVEELKEKS